MLYGHEPENLVGWQITVTNEFDGLVLPSGIILFDQGCLVIGSRGPVGLNVAH